MQGIGLASGRRRVGVGAGVVWYAQLGAWAWAYGRMGVRAWAWIVGSWGRGSWARGDVGTWARVQVGKWGAEEEVGVVGWA